MKHKLLLLVLAVLLPTTIFAQSFTATTVEGVEMEFNRNGTQSCKVYKINKDIQGGVTIPSEVQGYRVTTIGEDAFSGCTGLTSVDIPNSVTTIGDYAFAGCTGLTSVIIPNSVITIGASAFYYCTGLSSINIPYSVRTIQTNPFSGCIGLTSIIVEKSNKFYDSREDCNAIINTTLNTLVTGCANTVIPNSVTSINLHAFDGCTGLTSVDIPNSVEIIGNYAFPGCTGLTYINIPNSVRTIGDHAFEGCSRLEVICCNRTDPPSAGKNSFPDGATAIVPSESVSKYKSHLYWKKWKINTFAIVQNTTQTTITLSTVSSLFSNMTVEYNGSIYTPENGIFRIAGLMPATTYNMNTTWKHGDTNWSGTLTVSTKSVDLNVSAVKKTNVTATLKGSYNAGDASITEHGFENYQAGKDELLVTDLQPGKSYDFMYYVVANGKKITKAITVTTVPVSFSVTATPQVSTCTVTGDYSVIDAIVEDFGFTDYPQQKEISLQGLNPNSEYSRTFYVKIKGGETYTKDVTFTTGTLTLTTQQPKVISAGNVIVAAESNLDDEETNVGFEWRRTDWTNDFASNTGGAVLYNGTMEGYIRNLNTEKLWKFRPYYLSNSGTYYYGDWVGLDPSNTSYFEPTVHTYAKVNIEGNQALVKGYALGGTDKVKIQGFKYWKTAAGANLRETAQHRAAAVPSDAMTEEVAKTGSGQQLMNATLKGLDYNSTYHYVAFVTTEEGDTFYGEEQTFTTGEDPTGIEGIEDGSAVNKPAKVVARYNMNGQRITVPQKGVNILRMSDGTVKKVLVK